MQLNLYLLFRMIDMIHHRLWAFALICSWGLVAGAGVAGAEQLPIVASPACLYESRTYSDGAYICVQKSLMLTCTSDSARASWKIVADRDLSSRCETPVALAVPLVRRRHARRTQLARRRIEPAQASAKCFSFNNKQYCE